MMRMMDWGEVPADWRGRDQVLQRPVAKLDELRAAPGSVSSQPRRQVLAAL